MELWDVYDEHRNLTGRTHVRSEAGLAKGDYHVVVHIWIKNAKEQYLISKRTPNKSDGNLWECTGGAVTAGEDSFTAALREAKEELGIELDPLNGALMGTHSGDDWFLDSWLFCQEVDLDDVVLQPGETCGAMWATLSEMKRMLNAGTFVPMKQDSFGMLERYTAPLAFFPKEASGEMRYSVTAAKHRGKWVFVRHKDRDTFELPGGHIEPGEEPEDAARRELREESGAKKFELWPVAPYAVMRGDDTSCGLLAFAAIDSFDEIPEDFEMAERTFFDDAPDNLTYPTIVPKLIARAERWIAEHATTVYFVRHAKPDRSVHQDDIRPLTAEGERDAAMLVERFRRIHIDAIYTSPYLRAEQTVLPLAIARGLAIGEVWDFRERKVDDHWIEDWHSFIENQWADRDYKLPGGESLNEVAQRNMAALEPILKKRAGQTLVIGTHGTALSTILSHCDPARGLGAFVEMMPKMPHVVRLRFVGDHFIDIREDQM